MRLAAWLPLFYCPACDRETLFEGDYENHAGGEIECPKCQQLWRIDAADDSVRVIISPIYTPGAALHAEHTGER